MTKYPDFAPHIREALEALDKRLAAHGGTADQRAERARLLREQDSLSLAKLVRLINEAVHRGFGPPHR